MTKSLYDPAVAKAADERATERTKIENAKNFLAMGLSVEKVAEGTGLPASVVESIAQNVLR